MVWKMFEEFHDGSLMLGPLRHLNGMVTAFQCNPSACCLSPNGMVLAISESPCCRKHSIKFLLKRIYGLEVLVEEFQDGG